MKIYIHLFGAFILLLALTACEKELAPPKDTSWYSLKGSVKSLTQSTDYSNQPDANDYYAENKLIVTFNQSGMRINSSRQFIDQTNPKSKPSISRNEFIYDSDGKLTQQTSYQDFQSAQKLIYLYKNNQQLPYASTQVNQQQDKYMNLFKYDDQGNLISVTTKDKNNKTTSSYTARFNKQGRVTVLESNVGNDFQSRVETSYNPDGFTKKKIRTIQDEKSILTYEYLKTDESGNWTERKVITDGSEGYVIESREIIYF